VFNHWVKESRKTLLENCIFCSRNFCHSSYGSIQSKVWVSCYPSCSGLGTDWKGPSHRLGCKRCSNALRWKKRPKFNGINRNFTLFQIPERETHQTEEACELVKSYGVRGEIEVRDFLVTPSTETLPVLSPGTVSTILDESLKTGNEYGQPPVLHPFDVTPGSKGRCYGNQFWDYISCKWTLTGDNDMRLSYKW